MNNIRLFFILLLVFSTVGCADKAELKPLAADATILAFGDSLTYGYGADRIEAYPAQLALLTGLNVINAGISGEETSEGLARLPKVLAETRPQLVILCEGGNDMLRKRNLKQTIDNLKQMIAIIRATGAEVLLMAAPKPGLLLSPAPFYQQVAEATNTPMEDEIMARVLQLPSTKSDTIHPNAKGYRQVAEALQKKLQQLGAL